MKGFKIFAGVLAGLIASATYGQSTVTLTPSVISGDGQVTIPTMSWATSPPLTVGTPCTASSVPANAGWTGAKAGNGTVNNLLIPVDTLLRLSCSFSGDSIVTFSWTNATLNTNGTPYNNPKNVRIKYTFGATLGPSATIASPGEIFVDVADVIGTRVTMRTVTGISQNGTLRGGAFHQNQNDAFSAMSNTATKVFTGSVIVNQEIGITVRPVPNGPMGFGAQ